MATHHIYEVAQEAAALGRFFLWGLPPHSPKHRGLQRQGGFALVATILVMGILLALASAMVTMTQNNLQSVSGFSKHHHTENIALLGFEKATSDLANDSNWTDNTTPYNGSYLGGTLTLTFSNGSPNAITVTSTARYQGTQVQRQKRLQRTTGMAHTTQVSTANAYFTNGTVLNQITLSNTGTSNASIVGMILTWDPPTPPNTIASAAINGLTKWTASPANTPHTSGRVLTFSTPYTLTAGSVDIPLSITFNQTMTNTMIAIVLQFSDGSSRAMTYLPESGAAAALSVDVSNANVAGSGDKEIRDIVVTNTGTSSISITHMTLSWIYNDPVLNIDRIRFDSSSVWTGNASSGTTLTTPRTLSAGSSDILNLRFKGDMDYARVDIVFTLSDGTTKTAVADFRIDQASYLDVTVDNAAINGANLQNLVLENTHSEANIWLDHMIIAMAPNTLQTINSITLDGDSLFAISDEPDDLGSTLDLDLTKIDTTPMTQDIQFSTLSGLHDFTITYIMRDGSSKTVVRNFASEGWAADSVAGNTSNITIDTGLDLMENLSVSKNGNATPTFQNMQISWDPSSSLKLKSIHIDGIRLFHNGSGVNTGTTVTLSSPKTLSASNTDIDLTFTGGNASDRDITTTLIFSDGSSKSFTAFLNPENSSVWVAADNFEANEGLSGGAGFASNWVISDTLSNTFQSGGNSYSGNRHMRLRQQHNASRTLSNAATSSTYTITYTIRLNGYDNGETGYLETRKNGNGAWTIVRSFSRPSLSNSTFYKFTDTLSPTLGQKFEIRFRGNANSSNEYLYIDEVFIR